MPPAAKIYFFTDFYAAKPKFHFFYIAATALGPSSKDWARCEVLAGIKDLSVRPLSVEL